MKIKYTSQILFGLLVGFFLFLNISFLDAKENPISHLNGVVEKKTTSVIISHPNPFNACIMNASGWFNVGVYKTRAEMLGFFDIEENGQMWNYRKSNGIIICSTENSFILGNSIIDLFLKYYEQRKMII